MESKKYGRCNKNSIPERWEIYSNFNTPINGTCILPCKTPINDKLYNNGVRSGQLNADQHFTPQDLITQVRENLNLEVKCVIDFTNTDRYYNANILEDSGIIYKKIRCPGKVIPPEYVYEEFSEAMQSFVPGLTDCSVIAVHCTHGVNRTGYIICKYLMDKLNYAVEDAIHKYEEARGHCIERKEYTDKLRTLSRIKQPFNGYQHINNPGTSIEQNSNVRKRQSKILTDGISHPRYINTYKLIHFVQYYLYFEFSCLI